MPQRLPGQSRRHDWMIERIQVDEWKARRTGADGTTMGLTNCARQAFALDHVRAHEQ